MMTQINLVPAVSGVGGMVSFHRRFSAGVKNLGIKVAYDFNMNDADALLVIGGTRNFYGLLQAKKRGIRIVQRLNGMNWLHRKLTTGIKHYLRAEYGNLVLRMIRHHFADHIIYQSFFAKDWWERRHGIPNKPTSVVYNGVDLEQYSPDRFTKNCLDDDKNDCQRPIDRFRILMVEGSLMGGYEIGLEAATNLVSNLYTAYRRALTLPVELMIVGKVSEKLREQWSARSNFPLIWIGPADPDQIPCLDHSAHLFFSSDINAACPNAVIEALACGTPVLGYDTGALPEMISYESGGVVPYGGDPWKLEEPDSAALAKRAVEILMNLEKYRIGARKRAQVVFGLDHMIHGYLDALLASS